MNLNSLKEMKLNSEKTDTVRPLNINKDIAIIGIDAKVSCANSVEEFWKYIEGGCDLIHDFPEERKEDANRISLLRTGYELDEEILQYGYLDRIDLFDPDVFGIMKPEATLMDPNQRLFLESAWKAIEDAGYGGARLKGTSTGVYIGVNNIQNHYGGTMDENMDASLYGLAVSGNVNSIVASRISYHLNLKGPAVVFDTACSSSLVAVHFACQQLKSREVSTALVGGIRVGIIPPQGGGKHFGIEAFSGRTRSYDMGAEGTGGGEGVVCMVLKRLEDAKRDHDHIYAVIKGSAINQDGTSVGITAPNALSQEECIKHAWKDAGIDPETISYIEGHGTATALGDPIEITGIEKAFRNYSDKKQFCAVGSVKSNVGHLDSAAGIVGLLKVILMMKYKKIPASIHFWAPNKKINFIESPVYINDTCVYEKVMNPDTCWELREHMLNGEPVLPGSALIEMAYWGAKQVYPQKNIELRELQYLSPLHCAMDETRIVHLTVSIQQDGCLVQIVSREENKGDWTTHLEVKVFGHAERTADVVVEQELIPLHEVTEADALKQVAIASTQGSHWNNLERMFIADKQIAVLLDSSKIVQNEKVRYYLYPPTLDTSLNAGTYIVEGEYLPFSFERAVLYSNLPDRFYSFIKQNDAIDNTDLISFDIILCTEAGKVIAEISNYMICRVLDSTHFITNLKLQKELFYKTEWVAAEPELAALDLSEGQQNVLIVCRSGQNIDALSEQFSKYRLFFAFVGEENRRESENKWYICNDEESYIQLFANLKKHSITKIVQFMGYMSVEIECSDELNREVALLLKSTFFIVKALVKNGMKQDIAFLLVSKNGKMVTADDSTVIPLHTALIGLGTCIEDEYSNITVHAVDIDDATSLKVIYSELKSDEQRYLVAYREGQRYIEKIVNLPYSDRLSRTGLDLKEDGVYVIAGGLGGMGLVIMQYLFEHQPKAKIVLLNRTYSDSSFLSAESSNDMILQSKQQMIFEARNKGCQVEIVQVDISNYCDVERVFAYVRNKYEMINGVINAAGIAGDGFIYHKDWKDFENVLKPKINGSWNLDRVTADDNLDFFVMCSSLTAIFGAPGQSDYAAANAFLDGFTYYRNLRLKHSLTIDWTGWSEVGMAASNETAMRQSYVKFLNNEEGALAFAYAVKTQEARVLIGKFNMEQIENNSFKLSDKIGMDEILEEDNQTANLKEKGNISFEDIVVYGKNIEELTQIEKKIVSIWANVLETTEIDVYDKFFEIGGNSLLALNLQKALNAEFGSMLTITDIFVYSSIIELAEYITSSSAVKTEPPKIETSQKQTTQLESNIDDLYEQLMNGELDTEQILNI